MQEGRIFSSSEWHGSGEGKRSPPRRWVLWAGGSGSLGDRRPRRPRGRGAPPVPVLDGPLGNEGVHDVDHHLARRVVRVDATQGRRPAIHQDQVVFQVAVAVAERATAVVV